MTTPEAALSRGEMESFAVSMATDAFRICVGQKPKHKPSEVMRWMRAMERATTGKARAASAIQEAK